MAARRIYRFIDRPGFDQEARDVIRRSLEDIREGLVRAEALLALLGSRGTEAAGEDTPGVLRARKHAAAGDAEPLSLRDALVRCVHTVNREGARRWVIPDRGQDAQIRVDQVTLMEILTNLVDNAEKYRAPATDVICALRDRPYGVAMVVSNLGRRMEPEEETRIFERQYRGFEARRRDNSGSGMGLYVIKRLCQEYGVEIYHSWRHATTDIGHYSGLVWHDFTLEIPKDLIVGGSRW